MNIIVTGGHSGIGLELTKLLLNNGHTVGLIIRSMERQATVLSDLASPDNIDFFTLV